MIMKDHRTNFCVAFITVALTVYTTALRLPAEEIHPRSEYIIKRTSSNAGVYQPRELHVAFDDRNTWQIIWSCLATLFACTWLSVHSNIPPAHSSARRIYGRRLATMLYLLVFPEVVLSWAARQYFGARHFGKKYKDRGWTTTHAFFLIMGGFVLYDGNTFLYTLYPDTLEELYDAGKIDWPSIDEGEIMDRSKADFFSKGVAVIQTTWFIIQCISRTATKLVVTELEVATLALAALNGIAYHLWWHKPLDVKYPIKVYLRPQKAPDSDDTENPASLEEVAETSPKEENPETSVEHLARSSPPPSIPKSSPSKLSQWWNAFRLLMSAQIKKRGYILAVVNVFFKRPFSQIFDELGDMIASEKLVEGGSHVPPYCCPAFLDEAGEDGAGVTGVYLLLIPAVFGGVHLAAWRYPFPTVVERWMWRSAALTITVAPYAIIYAISLQVHPFFSTDTPRARRAFKILYFVVLQAILWPMYIASRAALLILPLVSLRQLPDSAYMELQWTKMFPHV